MSLTSVGIRTWIMIASSWKKGMLLFIHVLTFAVALLNLKLGCGWIITHCWNAWSYLLFHALISVNLCLERSFLPQWRNIYKLRHVNIVLRGCYLCHVIRRHRKQWRSSHATTKKRPWKTPWTIAWGRAHWIFIQWDAGEVMAVVTATHIMCT